MKITKREIIFSVIIIAVMLVLGFTIKGHIQQHKLEDYQEYDTAMKIDSDEELFRYGMRTNIGNAFVYGELIALDPVSYPAINGEYSYVRKEDEEYRRHTRLVTETYTDSDGETHTKTVEEEYWSWDNVKTSSKSSTKITFLNVEFPYEKIRFPGASYIATIDTGYHTRSIYYGTGTHFKGTIYARLGNDTISKASFYNNRNIDQTVDSLESNAWIVIFWIGWIILTAGAVIAFYYFENEWLED